MRALNKIEAGAVVNPKRRETTFDLDCEAGEERSDQSLHLQQSHTFLPRPILVLGAQFRLDAELNGMRPLLDPNGE
jgi:hypothetical protein